MFWGGCPDYLSSGVAACGSEIAIRFEWICVLSEQLYGKCDYSTACINPGVESLVSKGEHQGSNTHNRQ